MSVADQPRVMTEHALLVSFGRFAHQIGLIEALDRIPIPMKTFDHSPGDKLAELLVPMLAGGMHVKELETRRRVTLIAQRLTQIQQERGQRRQKHLAEEVAHLQARQEEMRAENAANPQPRRIILRLDGSFGDAPQLAWLSEQGYDFVVRAHN